ncbi:aspartate-semialdehyde dehydrogenase [Natranaerobius trueperi]|uniref:Aspartate-semialdehyde dehydrogenase n=1 Tax=Natranaerobius trueperi TaxID=759412 RepID=A0A226BX29_9FIRM|nr:aspartate-semialdehyde dehydrogenase [Natranaerobius trueperi]OWZ83598.1 aspartate-semialdehyde dehydrogenase [Natranaerobius trueperi]
MLNYKLGIVGATGLVGNKILEILEEKEVKPKELRLFASSRSAGNYVDFMGDKLKIEDIKKEPFDNLDIVMFATSSDISRELVPQAVKKGAIAIDNSSYFRLHEDVPLVVPEVNVKELEHHNGIVANPNCSTIQLVVPLKVIDEYYSVKRVIVNTYQAVSGSGKNAIDELKKNSLLELSGLRDSVKCDAYPKNIAFNCLPHVDDFTESRYTKEELKMINETKKIISPNIEISPTCIRVATLNGHGESVNIETNKGFSRDELTELLSKAKGITVVDDPESLSYPTPIENDNRDEILVGRIRKDSTIENGVNLWITADNLRKGAATNAVQILENLLKKC